MCAVLAAAPTLLPPALGQDTTYQFWSGTVSDIADDSISVRRALPGREPETSQFVLTATTRIDGDLQRSSRVTVCYVQHDERRVVHRILVRKPRHRHR